MMKNKSFTVIVGLIVALLSVSVIAAMVSPEHFAIQKESDSALPEYTSPSGIGDQNGSADPHKDESLLDSSLASSSPDESFDSSEESAADTPEWGSGEVYDGSAPIIRKMGEELRINALPHRKQTEKPPMSTEVFALWEGELSFTVTDAEIYDSIEETGLNPDDFVTEFDGYEKDGFKPLVVKMTVENIRARSLVNPRSTENDPDPSIFYSDVVRISCKEEFSPEKFRTHVEGELPFGAIMPLAYIDRHMDGPYDYYFYTLKEGEAADLTMCFYVYTVSAPLDELYLEIDTNSKDHRFGIALDQLKGVE